MHATAGPPSGLSAGLLNTAGVSMATPLPVNFRGNTINVDNTPNFADCVTTNKNIFAVSQLFTFNYFTLTFSVLLCKALATIIQFKQRYRLKWGGWTFHGGLVNLITLAKAAYSVSTPHFKEFI